MQEIQHVRSTLCSAYYCTSLTQFRIDGVNSLVQEMKSVQPDVSASLVKLIEDLFTR